MKREPDVTYSACDNLKRIDTRAVEKKAGGSTGHLVKCVPKTSGYSGLDEVKESKKKCTVHKKVYSDKGQDTYESGTASNATDRAEETVKENNAKKAIKSISETGEALLTALLHPLDRPERVKKKMDHTKDIESETTTSEGSLHRCDRKKIHKIIEHVKKRLYRGSDDIHSAIGDETWTKDTEATGQKNGVAPPHSLANTHIPKQLYSSPSAPQMLLTRSCLQLRSVQILVFTSLRCTLVFECNAVLILELQRGHILMVQLVFTVPVVLTSPFMALQSQGLLELPV